MYPSEMALPQTQERRAAIYVRISEDKVGARLGVERQAADCRELAERLGWTVVATFEDNDVSAYSGKPRPGYRRLETALSDGSVDAVLAWHPDRLHRSPLELEGFINLVEGQRAQVATVQAGEMDLSTPSGRLVARQLGSVARYESEHKAERIRRALAQRRQAGEVHGGRRMYGYHGLAIDAEEAAHIRWVVAEILNGAAWNEVVARLNERGSMTTVGNPWDRRTLKRVIGNPRLRGQVVHRGAAIGSGRWTAVISAAEWARLRPRVEVDAPPQHARYMLSGILRCGKCGLGLTHGSGRTTPRPSPPIYWCTPKPGGVRRGCGGISIAQPLAEAAVTAIVLDALGDARPATGGGAVEELETELTTLRVRQQEIAAALVSGSLSIAVASRADTQLAGEILAIEGKISGILATERVSQIGRGDIATTWQSLDDSQRRSLVSDVIDHVVVKPVNRGWHGKALDRMEVVWRR